MKKDGTRYLCEVEFENGDMDFVVLYWGTPVGFSGYYGEPGWYTSGGSRVKLKKIFCYRKCDSIFPVQTDVKGTKCKTVQKDLTI